MLKKYFIFILIFILTLYPVSQLLALHFAEGTSGMILLQVEAKGEAWYVFPDNGERYYLGRPSDAFEVMKKLSLGAKHSYITDTEIFPQRLAGKILLDVEKHGEAYYIYPVDLKKYYLSRPSDAFRIMRELGLGITNADLVKIPLGDIQAQIIDAPKDETVIYNVPFASQAPFGDWSDQRQQDGCEEASALMAVSWARGETFTKEVALATILDISDFELEKYGEYRDVSSADSIAWIYNDYFDFPNATLKKNISIDDIISELNSGNIVVTPHNGQLLHNPNFTPPGPIRHMLLIRGYDAATGEFITNDPGTRNGEGYRYSAITLFNAIRDYPTGYHEHIDSIEKNMIVISK